MKLELHSSRVPESNTLTMAKGHQFSGAKAFVTRALYDNNLGIITVGECGQMQVIYSRDDY